MYKIAYDAELELQDYIVKESGATEDAARSIRKQYLGNAMNSVKNIFRSKRGQKPAAAINQKVTRLDSMMHNYGHEAGAAAKKQIRTAAGNARANNIATRNAGLGVGDIGTVGGVTMRDFGRSGRQQASASKSLEGFFTGKVNNARSREATRHGGTGIVDNMVSANIKSQLKKLPQERYISSQVGRQDAVDALTAARGVTARRIAGHRTESALKQLNNRGTLVGLEDKLVNNTLGKFINNSNYSKTQINIAKRIANEAERTISDYDFNDELAATKAILNHANINRLV